METSLIGEMDMLRELGVRPSFPEMARRYGMDRHAAAKHWKEGEGMEDGRSARRSGFDRYRDETGDRAQMSGVTMKAIHEWLLDRHPDGKLPKYGAFRHWMDARGLKAGQPLPDAHPRHGTEPGRQLQFDWKERLLLHGRDGADTGDVARVLLGLGAVDRDLEAAPVRGRLPGDVARDGGAAHVADVAAQVIEPTRGHARPLAREGVVEGERHLGGAGA